MNENNHTLELVDRAAAGDRAALGSLLAGVQDLVFNLSLRMLGSFPDAEDASQEILLKVMTHLSGFRKECAFSTWVFQIASNYLRSYHKHMFAQQPLSFEFYSYDILHGHAADLPDQTQNVDRNLLSEELKYSCTNVMLQCLDAESRCIFILGTMFRLDSRIAGEILGLSPEAYRQRLSRTRKKMAEFLSTYCGACGSGPCQCSGRVDYAIQTHRLFPNALPYTAAQPLHAAVKDAMEQIDDLAQAFACYKLYASPAGVRQYITDLLASPLFSTATGS